MKTSVKQFLLTIAFCFCFSITYSQDSALRKKPAFLSASVAYANTNTGTPGGPVKMKERDGVAVNVHFIQYLSRVIYLKTGASYVFRSVNPHHNTLYETKLRTHHIVVPMIAGLDLVEDGKKVDMAFEFGPAASILLKDKSYIGSGQVDANTNAVALSLCPGWSFGFGVSHSARFLLHYSYMIDVTSSHVQKLYSTSAEPVKTLAYKYKTHVISAGIIWSL